MKTLADIKRRVRPGTRLEVVEQTKRPVLVGTIRTVIRASSSNLVFTSDNTGGEEYHQVWPKAAEVRVVDADTYEWDMRGPGNQGHHVRLRFLPDA